MRTTVTLDPDVVDILQAQMREGGFSFKEALNNAVRQSSKAARPRRAFVVEAVAMGAPQADLTKALALASALEDEEILHKLSMRK